MNSELSKKTSWILKDLKSYLLFHAQVLGAQKVREIKEGEDSPQYKVASKMSHEIDQILDSLSQITEARDFYPEEIAALENLKKNLGTNEQFDLETSANLFGQIQNLANNLKQKRPWQS
ncbi:hypothetical protein HOF92_13690 [bacterium]|jgi:vacuolar-type H+-ATPase subunit I/STV1|nr:hypothetical protein [bacterium]